MENLEGQRPIRRAKITNDKLPSFGKVVTIVKRVDRFHYLVEFTPGGKLFKFGKYNLELI